MLNRLFGNVNGAAASAWRSQNLLVRFSVLSMVLMLALGVGLSTMLSAGLSHNLELIEAHGWAMMDGSLEMSDPWSLPNILDDVTQLQKTTQTAVGVGFVVVYAGLMYVVWGAWKTIKRQRTDLTSGNEKLQATVEELRSQVSSREAADEANQAKSEFLSTVSHELKTPLTSIVAFTGLLLRNKDDLLGERDMHKLHIVNRNGERLRILIDDLLDFSRIEAGTVDVLSREIDVREVLDELHDSFQPIFEAKRQTLTVSLPSVSVRINADPERLGQVVSNLLSNASKYSPEETRTELLIWSDSTDAYVAVRDHGIGIRAEDLANVFTPFFRVDNEETRQVPGAGLGLAISQGIIDLHGGDISAVSRVGGGTEFRIRLPLVTSAKVSEERRDESARLSSTLQPIAEVV